MNTSNIERGGGARAAAVSRLPLGRRGRLYIWRSCHQRKSGSFTRARADARPLRGGRNHRPFLSHRTEWGFGAARAGVWTTGGTGSCQFPADPVTSETILGGTTTMASENNDAFIRNIAE